ncbi:hypothetical protein NM208_g7068 [Fusarium decemcellulare]|uniref:Uncharacterized protein n=1 Tax=Fusarium decemcellulare TaxID=57161 RepID=A0ACC1SAL7_9HYPO|nr:hypothetical protein NM208_g7068 [Fusarium decemcellulare]
MTQELPDWEHDIAMVDAPDEAEFLIDDIEKASDKVTDALHIRGTSVVDVIQDNAVRIMWTQNDRKLWTAHCARHKLHLGNCDILYLDELIADMGLTKFCHDSSEYRDVVYKKLSRALPYLLRCLAKEGHVALKTRKPYKAVWKDYTEAWGKPSWSGDKSPHVENKVVQPCASPFDAGVQEPPVLAPHAHHPQTPFLGAWHQSNMGQPQEGQYTQLQNLAQVSQFHALNGRSPQSQPQMGPSRGLHHSSMEHQTRSHQQMNTVQFRDTNGNSPPQSQAQALLNLSGGWEFPRMEPHQIHHQHPNIAQCHTPGGDSFQEHNQPSSPSAFPPPFQANTQELQSQNMSGVATPPHSPAGSDVFATPIQPLRPSQFAGPGFLYQAPPSPPPDEISSPGALDFLTQRPVCPADSASCLNSPVAAPTSAPLVFQAQNQMCGNSYVPSVISSDQAIAQAASPLHNSSPTPSQLHLQADRQHIPLQPNLGLGASMYAGYTNTPSNRTPGDMLKKDVSQPVQYPPKPLQRARPARISDLVTGKKKVASCPPQTSNPVEPAHGLSLAVSEKTLVMPATTSKSSAEMVPTLGQNRHYSSSNSATPRIAATVTQRHGQNPQPPTESLVMAQSSCAPSVEDTSIPTASCQAPKFSPANSSSPQAPVPLEKLLGNILTLGIFIQQNRYSAANQARVRRAQIQLTKFKDQAPPDCLSALLIWSICADVDQLSSALA